MSAASEDMHHMTIIPLYSLIVSHNLGVGGVALTSLFREFMYA
jgi:hypothetical protein